jgi:hypothetical protein
MTEADTQRLLAAVERISNSLSAIVTQLEEIVANLDSVTEMHTGSPHLRVGSVD